MRTLILCLLLCIKVSNVYSIKCWSCGYAEDEDGNRMEIPAKFQDQNVSFCDDFIDASKIKNLTKEYPKVPLYPTEITEAFRILIR